MRRAFDLPGWQELQDELSDEDFIVIAVAIDEDLEAVQELAKDTTYPVLMDKDHLLTELYAISNVPTVIWIDEKGKIARPAASEFGTDVFTEITGIKREFHMQQVRDWVKKERCLAMHLMRCQISHTKKSKRDFISESQPTYDVKINYLKLKHISSKQRNLLH